MKKDKKINVDGYEMTEQQLTRLREAAQLVKEFCALNHIPRPRHIAFYDAPSGECGCYYSRSSTIQICPAACSKEVQNPANMRWSHPHYFTDRTIYGVLHHEFGHYVHEYLKYPKLPPKHKITSYEPNMSERFAETMKLFLGNPDLLREYAPARYNKMISLGLKPVYNTPWREVMARDGMSRRFIDRAAEKIAKNND